VFLVLKKQLCSLDFTSYQALGYLIEDEFKIENKHQPLLPAKVNLHFKHDTSSEDSSDPKDPDYQPFEEPHLIG
jgi:hypothetical protein